MALNLYSEEYATKKHTPTHSLTHTHTHKRSIRTTRIIQKGGKERKKKPAKIKSRNHNTSSIDPIEK